LSFGGGSGILGISKSGFYGRREIFGRPEAAIFDREPDEIRERIYFKAKD
jgi:hypothetical protein